MLTSARSAFLALALVGSLATGTAFAVRQFDEDGNVVSRPHLAAPFLRGITLVPADPSDATIASAQASAFVTALRDAGMPAHRHGQMQPVDDVFMDDWRVDRLPGDAPALARIFIDPGDDRLWAVPEAWHLIDRGPAAISALLAAINDGTPVGDTRGMSGSFMIQEDHYFPLSRQRISARERTILEAKLPRIERDEPFATQGKKIARGDFAAAILGTIVNRDYEVFDGRIVTGSASSPVLNPAVAEAMREMWTSADPRRLLLTSLLDDVARGDGAADGAVVRLALYFPKETAAAFAAALDAGIPIGVGESSLSSTAIAALALRGEPVVIDALMRRLAASKDEVELASLLAPAIFTHDGAFAAERLESIAKCTPSAMRARATRRAFGDALTFIPDRAGPAVVAGLATRNAERSRAILGALYHANAAPSWLVSTLQPALEDATPTRYPAPTYAPQEQTDDYLRVNDMAAMVLAKHTPSLHFDPSTPRAERDAAIAEMKKAVDALRRGDAVAAAPIELFGPSRLATLEHPKSWLRFSSASTADRAIGFFFGHCQDSSLDVVVVDLATGTSTVRPVTDESGQPLLGNTEIVGRHATGEPLLVVDSTRYRVNVDTGRAVKLEELPEANPARNRKSPVVVLDDAIISSDDKGDIYRTQRADGTRTLLAARPKSGRESDDFFATGTSLHKSPVSSKILVDRFANDGPPTMIDLATGVASPLEGFPSWGYDGFVGPYLVNNVNGQRTLWDMDTRSRVVLPVLPGDSRAAVGTLDGKIVVVVRSRGDVVVVDVEKKAIVAATAVAVPDEYPALQLSSDERTLFVVQQVRDAEQSAAPLAIEIMTFDVSRWTRPSAAP
ncbi:MAG: hypothetical protein JNM94_16170 [Phycisphaerae bacterium]|nr:hypothetical protein [Phycisphaerae bacterium]